jgi:hypothetical protein
MKKLLLLLLLTVVSLTSYSQTVTQSDLDNMVKRTVMKRFTKFVDGNGNEYKVGDVLTIGYGSNNGKFVHLLGFTLLSSVPVLPAQSGKKITIAKIRVTGSKRNGFKVFISSKPSGIITFMFDLKSAVDTGEIVGKGYSSDAALTELKKAKDKLELGLINQEEFDSKRKELSKYIK